MCKAEHGKLIVMDFIIFALSRFRTNLLAPNHLITWKRTDLAIEQNSSKFLLELMTLASSANNISSEREFVLCGRSCMCIKNNKGPRIEPWGTPCFTIPLSEEEVWAELEDVWDFSVLWGPVLIQWFIPFVWLVWMNWDYTAWHSHRHFSLFCYSMDHYGVILAMFFVKWGCCCCLQIETLILSFKVLY